MKIKHKLAVVALATGIAGGVMAAPAVAASSPNDSGANCNGVVVSNFSTNIPKPGQAAAYFYGSVQEAHREAKAFCS